MKNFRYFFPNSKHIYLHKLHMTDRLGESNHLFLKVAVWVFSHFNKLYHCNDHFFFFFSSMFHIFYVFYVYLPKAHLNKLQAANKLILKELSSMPCY